MINRIKVGGVIQNEHLAAISILAVKDRPGIAAAVLEALGERGLNVQFVVQVIDHEAQTQMVLCVDRTDLPGCIAAIEALRPEIQPVAISPNPDVASIAVFGPDFRDKPGIAGHMFRALAAHGVNILAISTSISTVNCIIDAARLPEASAAVSEYFELP